jgi:protein-arginine kinase activator protein McsA
MKNEMIKFVSENFDVIKNEFIDNEKDNFFMIDEIKEIEEAEELLEMINECSLGVDYEDFEDANELFDMIKAMKEQHN